MNSLKKQKGLTLIETLVVCVIIGILLTAAVPTFQELVENIKTETIAEEIHNDLNSTKIASVSIGQDYTFEFLNDGWEISSGGNTIKRKEIINNNLYIEESLDEITFKPLGFAKDKNGNTLPASTFKICNANTLKGYLIGINGFGKTTIKEGLCD